MDSSGWNVWSARGKTGNDLATSEETQWIYWEKCIETLAAKEDDKKVYRYMREGMMCTG